MQVLVDVALSNQDFPFSRDLQGANNEGVNVPRPADPVPRLHTGFRRLPKVRKVGGSVKILDRSGLKHQEPNAESSYA